jgi:hypothetical protein
MRHPGSHNSQACGLKSGVDLPDHVFGNRIGLDDGKCSFDSHEKSFALKNYLPIRQSSLV